MNDRIAIVGAACQFAEAPSPDILWRNVLATRRSFRELPSGRMNLRDYYAADRSAPDKTYARVAAVLEDYAFDRLRFKVPATVHRTFDVVHWLALDVADRALKDAGFHDLPIDPRRVSVLLGNTLTGDRTRSTVLRLRWPFVSRALRSVLARHAAPDHLAQLLEEIEQAYKAPFDPVNEETLAGGLSNTIAGRICNYYDFGGGGYTVDGACSSSLLTVIQASIGLQRGDVDFALAGGVDVSIDPFELVGFAKTNALADDLMRVYDRRSEGFWPGEGCGVIALAREEDARRWGIPIHAIIAGFGISSDGHGGITRPESAGHALAMDRAYAAAGYGADTVSLFEGHGTGTAVGDAAEVAAISGVRRSAGAQTAAALGSIKANIGHTKAAAGSAGLIKMMMSLRTGVIPPTTGCELPIAPLVADDRQLEVRREAADWPTDRPARASVSAVGFGGINSHVTLEAADGPRRRLWSATSTVAQTGQDCELIPLAASDLAELARAADELAARANALTIGRLADLAITRCRSTLPGQSARAAVVARTPAELAARCRELADRIESGATTFCSTAYSFSDSSTAPRIGLLFSGQGAPVRLDAGAVGRRFPAVRQRVAEAALHRITRTDTALAQPAIAAQSAATVEALAALGLEASAATGHSLGELSALQWAGYLTSDELVDLATTRGAAMSDCDAEPGGMVELRCDETQARELMAGLRLSVAAMNAPDRVVVSGPLVEIQAVSRRAATRDVAATPLRVSHAFHSPLVADAASAVQSWFADHPGRAERRLTGTVVSTVTGRLVQDGGDVPALLAEQITAPVRFTDALETLTEHCDLLLEVGPGDILADLARAGALPAFALDAGAPSMAPFLAAVAACYALGSPIDLDALVQNRVAFETDPLRVPATLANPCETLIAPDPAQSGQEAGPFAVLTPAPAALPAPQAASEPAPAEPESASEPQAPQPSPEDQDVDVFAVVRDLVVAKTEFPPESVKPTSTFLVDLNLNSIAVAQVATDAARACGRTALLSPHEHAEGTIGDLVASLEASPLAGPERPAHEAIGVDDWVRPFEVVWHPTRVTGARRPVRWRLIDCGDLLTRIFTGSRQIQDALEGAVVELPAIETADDAAAAVATLADLARDTTLCRAVVGAHGGAAALVRTLQIERPDLAVRLVDVDSLAAHEPPHIDRILRRACEAGTGFEELRLAGDGSLESPRMQEMVPKPEPLDLPPASTIVVTGGGKGIGAEAALALARSYGLRLGIIGRSDPAADDELAANLARFAAQGIDVRYAAADVADRAALGAAVAAITTDLGPITGVLHASGVNDPALLHRLNAQEVKRTWATKVDGFQHLLDTLCQDDLRLVVTFGSVIGRSGMRGEGHYAVANEQLRLQVEEFARTHPAVRTLQLDWSVWAGVGMGAKLGLLDTLDHVGVKPIYPDAGVRILTELVSARGAVAPVVAGRYGLAQNVLPMAERDLPFLRFLERPLIHYPGIELVVEVDLSADTDRYLEDHTFDGMLLFPSVAGLEAMAQVARGLTGADRPTSIRDLEWTWPIMVAKDSATTIRIAGLVQPDGTVTVHIRSAESDFDVVHASGTFHMESTPATKRADGGTTALEAQTVSHALPSDRSQELVDILYGGLLFHGPRFQRVRSYEQVRSTRCRATVAADGAERWFIDYLPQDLVLGDLGARDAFLHAAQVCIPHRRVLPFRAARIDLRIPFGASQLFSIDSCERARTSSGLTFDLDVVNGVGPVETWRGLELRAVDDAAPSGPWPSDLLATYLERRLTDLWELPDQDQLTIALVPTSGVPVPDRSRTALEAVCPDQAHQLRHRPDGKPEMASGFVSFSHHAPLTLVALTTGADLGVDIEGIEHREPHTWRGMLGAALFEHAERLVAREPASPASTDTSQGRAFALDTVCTRLWSASEALKKTGISGPHHLRAAEQPSEREWTFTHGSTTVFTAVVPLAGIREPVVVAAVMAPQSEEGSHE